MGKIILFNDYLTAAAGGQRKPEKEGLFLKSMAEFVFPDFLIAP